MWSAIIDPQEAARLTAKYFGAEQRRQEPIPPLKPIVFPAGEERRLARGQLD